MTTPKKAPPDRAKPRPGDRRSVVVYARESVEVEGGDEFLWIGSRVAAPRERAAREG